MCSAVGSALVAPILSGMLLLATAGCGVTYREPYVYRVPPRLEDGWPVASLQEAGMDSATMAELVDAIRGRELPNLHSVLVVKDGRLVFEEYFKGADRRRGRSLGTVRFDHSTLHDLRSVTKSVTSTVIGIAVDRGLVSTSDTVGSFFPEHSDLVTQAKRAITVRHLLTMSAGLEWDESTYPYTDPRNSETAMDRSPSSVRFVLGQTLVADPGSHFQYSGGCTMLLAGIVRAATGQDLDDFAESALFHPLGISQFEWLQHKDGLPIAASGLRLRPRDMAKIGYLYVNEGLWDVTQVVSAAWLSEATEPHLAVRDDRVETLRAYGYLWWIDYAPLGDETVVLPVARGLGGQRIYVAPGLRLVAVITAGNYNRPGEEASSERAFWEYILPAASGG